MTGLRQSVRLCAYLSDVIGDHEMLRKIKSTLGALHLMYTPVTGWGKALCVSERPFVILVSQSEWVSLEL